MWLAPHLHRRLLPRSAGALVAVGLLLMGLVVPVHFVVWSAAFGVAAAAAVWARPDRPFHPVVLLLLGLVGLTALQLVPVSPALLAVLSPMAADLRNVLPDPTTAHPITLDAPATAREVARYVAYACVGIVGATCVQTAAGRRRLAHALVAAIGAFAVIAGVHTLAGAERIWWIYDQEQATTGLIKATLVNRNHIAAVLGAGVPLTIAVGLRQHRPWRRALVALGVAELVLVLLTLSRGGIVAACLGVLVLLVGVHQDTRASRRGTGRFTVAMVLLVAVGLAWLVAQPRFLGVYQESRAVGVVRDPKTLLWRASLDLVETHWLTGVGRGAFSLAMPRHLRPDLTAEATFHYAENLPLQWAAEWGVPAAVAALALLGLWLARAWRRRGGSLLRLGALVSLVVLLVHDLADFSLEMPAIAGLAVLLACVGSPLATPTSAPRRRWARGAVVAALLLTPLLTSGAVLRHQYRQDAEKLARILAAPGREVPPAARAIANRHPMDWAVHLLLGEWSAKRRRADAMVCFNRAMHLNPRGGAIHFSVGRALLRSGLVSQGLLELRLAQREAPLRSREIAEVAVSAVPSFARLRQFIGTGRLSGSRALLVAELLHGRGLARDYEEAVRYLAGRREAIFRDSGRAGLVEIYAERGQSAKAIELAHELAASLPSAATFARVLAVTSRIAAASDHLAVQRRALTAHPDAPGLLFVAGEDALRRRDTAGARRFADALRGVSGTDPAILAHARLIECEAALLDDTPIRATLAAQRGLADAPEDPRLLSCETRAMAASKGAAKALRPAPGVDDAVRP